MSAHEGPTTKLATHTNEELYYRDDGLVGGLMGNVTFTEMMFMHIMGRKATPGEIVILDAVLVTLMEHGLTPSAIATRLTYHSAPEALQAAVAAGLLNVGSQFVGTMENAAKLLMQLLEDEDGFDAAARREIKALRAAKRPLPGFGHHLHKPDDPRTARLFEIALSQEGIDGVYIDAMKRLSAIIDEELGRHLTINATGAVAAVLLEIGVEPDIMRGFSVISRAAGLVAHIREEQTEPTARHIWDVVEDTIPYVGDAPVDEH
ncbi:MAG: citryl-CoA lyase [Rhodospirillales bacterium]|nr:citryl-CoA lyase [Rhodospirillales bacterium]MBO6785594.1 citryl-CoA lyase [Rhodospirillales bacterium]